MKKIKTVGFYVIWTYAVLDCARSLVSVSRRVVEIRKNRQLQK